MKQVENPVPLRVPAGTRVRFKPSPVSLMLYSKPPKVGALGTVTETLLPTGRGMRRRTYMPGPGGGLVYVNWDDGSFQGVSSIDLEKVSERSTNVARRSRNDAACGPGELRIRRKGYKRTDGTRVASTSFCATDRGAPGRGPKVVPIKREGKLGGPGYLSKADSTRHKLLDACVRKWGYRSCLGSVNALAVLGKREFPKADLKRIAKDRDYLADKYGGKGSFERAANMHEGVPHQNVRRLKNNLLRMPR